MRRMVLVTLGALALALSVAVPTLAAPGDDGRAAITSQSAWLLQLPTTGGEGAVDEVSAEELTSYSSEFFSDTADGGVQLRTTADGQTTPNSSYSRSELREMDGEERAAWDTSGGPHVLDLRVAVTQLPEEKDEGSIAQVHGGEDDLLQIRLHGSDLRLHAQRPGADNSEYITSLDENYQLGTPFDLRVVVEGGAASVSYNGTLVTTVEIDASETAYFKAGAYIQANTSTDPASSAYEVVIYDIAVSHGTEPSAPAAPVVTDDESGDDAADDESTDAAADDDESTDDADDDESGDDEDDDSDDDDEDDDDEDDEDEDDD